MHMVIIFLISLLVLGKNKIKNPLLTMLEEV